MSTSLASTSGNSTFRGDAFVVLKHVDERRPGAGCALAGFPRGGRRAARSADEGLVKMGPIICRRTDRRATTMKRTTGDIKRDCNEGAAAPSLSSVSFRQRRHEAAPRGVPRQRPV